MIRWFFYTLVLVVSAPFIANAALVSRTAGTIDEVLRNASIIIAVAASIFIVFIVVLSAVIKTKTATLKKALFIAFLVGIVGPTAFFIGSTVYINRMSESGGPVHWHADFQIYACGQPIKLAGPTSKLSNKVGSAVLHHHSDNRIHLEGVVGHVKDFELQDFFATIGGELTETSFTIPTESGIRLLKNGVPCADTSPGTWQVFVYKQDKHDPSVFYQEKLASYTNYVLSPYEQIPPGDCIIMEFDAVKARTEHLCTFYKIELDKGTISIK